MAGTTTVDSSGLTNPGYIATAVDTTMSPQLDTIEAVLGTVDGKSDALITAVGSVDVKIDTVDANVDQLVLDVGALESFTASDRSTLTTTAASAASASSQAATAASEVMLARKIVHNRLEINFTTQRLVVYDDDGVTPLLQWPISTKDGEPVVTRTGVQTKRGKPV